MDQHVQQMSLEQEGAYLRLRDHAWLHGNIPLDLGGRAKVCRVPASKMARLWPGIAPCFTDLGGGLLAHPGLEEQRERLMAYRHERADAGRRGNDAKREKKARSANAELDAERTHSVLRTPFASPSASPSATPTTENERSLGVPSEQRPAYAEAVWDEFLRKSEHAVTRSISPGEYSTLTGWMDAGIPLAVILRGFKDTRGKGRMLGYFNSSVLEAYEKWRQAVPA